MGLFVGGVDHHHATQIGSPAHMGCGEDDLELSMASEDESIILLSMASEDESIILLSMASEDESIYSFRYQVRQHRFVLGLGK
jgi:hypothetical protein